MCLAGNKVAMVFTDPPYGVAYRDTGAGAWNAVKLAKKKAGTLKPRFEKIENDAMTGVELTAFWSAFLQVAVLSLAKKVRSIVALPACGRRKCSMRSGQSVSNLGWS